MNPRTMTPSILRIVLSVVMLLLVGAAVGVVMIGYNQLKTFAVAAQNTASQAQASESSVNNLVQTKKILEQDASTVQRAELLVAESKSYMYQDQIINDINKYAGEAGLSVTNITFTEAKTSSVAASSTSSAASSNTSTAAGSAGTTSATGGTPVGVKSMTATVTIKNPTDYDAMLTFIHLVEQSLFRMQISQISLSRSSDIQNPNKVSSDVLTIEVYVR